MNLPYLPLVSWLALASLVLAAPQSAHGEPPASQPTAASTAGAAAPATPPTTGSASEPVHSADVHHSADVDNTSAKASDRPSSDNEAASATETSNHVASVASSAPASEPSSSPAGPDEFPFERLNTWDLNIEGGVGSAINPGRVAGFGRLRGGFLAIRDNVHAMAGLTVEVGNLVPISFGLQAEIMHLEYGVWAQAGVTLDTKPRPGFMAAVGYASFGFEVQYRDMGPQNGSGPYQVAFFGKLRLPIRHIVKAFTGK